MNEPINIQPISSCTDSLFLQFGMMEIFPKYDKKIKLLVTVSFF